MIIDGSFSLIGEGSGSGAGAGTGKKGMEVKEPTVGEAFGDGVSNGRPCSSVEISGSVGRGRLAESPNIFLSGNYDWIDFAFRILEQEIKYWNRSIERSGSWRTVWSERV